MAGKSNKVFYHGLTRINTPCARVTTRKRWAQADRKKDLDVEFIIRVHQPVPAFWQQQGMCIRGKL